MNGKPPRSRLEPPGPWPMAVALAAWLVPGAGHWLCGQRWRGAAFLATLAATFAFGAGITEGAAVSWETHPLAFVAQAFAGAPFLGALALGRLRPPPASLPPGIVALLDLGLLFTMVAGLLNLLLVMDAHERAAGHRAAAPEAAAGAAEARTP